MQSRDESGAVKQLTPVDMGNPADLLEKMKAAEGKGAVSHTIGKPPKVGRHIEIDGLSYEVVFSDFVKGQPTVKLVCRNK